MSYWSRPPVYNPPLETKRPPPGPPISDALNKLAQPRRVGPTFKEKLASAETEELRRRAVIDRVKQTPLPASDAARLAQLAKPFERDTAEQAQERQAVASLALRSAPAYNLPVSYDQLKQLPPDRLASKVNELSRPRTVNPKFERVRPSHEAYVHRRSLLARPLSAKQHDLVASLTRTEHASSSGAPKWDIFQLQVHPGASSPSPARLAELSEPVGYKVRGRFVAPRHAPAPGPAPADGASDENVRAFLSARKAAAVQRREAQVLRAAVWSAARRGASSADPRAQPASGGPVSPRDTACACDGDDSHASDGDGAGGSADACATDGISPAHSVGSPASDSPGRAPELSPLPASPADLHAKPAEPVALLDSTAVHVAMQRAQLREARSVMCGDDWEVALDNESA